MPYKHTVFVVYVFVYSAIIESYLLAFLVKHNLLPLLQVIVHILLVFVLLDAEHNNIQYSCKVNYWIHEMYERKFLKNGILQLT